MARRPASRTSAAPSTLSGSLTPQASTDLLLPAGRPASSRRLRRQFERLGLPKSTLLITVITTVASFGIALMANAVFPPPPAMLVFSIAMSTLTPLVIAPPIAWFVVRLVFEAEDARRVAERLAATDPLTQAFNRRHFFRVGERELVRSQGAQQALSVLLLDIDNFKAVNDRYGHAIGDDVLKRVAQTCMDGMREHDLLARFGGEEFVVLLPATELVEAATVAERLRRAVEALAVPAGGTSIIRPTVSIGVATASVPASSLDGLLVSADQAMYLAKRGGRNRVSPEVAIA